MGLGPLTMDMALNTGIWDSKPRVTNIKGYKLKVIDDALDDRALLPNWRVKGLPQLFLLSFCLLLPLDFPSKSAILLELGFVANLSVS